VEPGHATNLLLPDLPADCGDGIAEGAVRLGVPGRGPGRERLSDGQIVRPESDEREQAEQRRSGAHDREVGPLALSFDAKMGTAFLERDLELPTRDEPLEDIDRSGIEISAEEGLRCKLAARIADQQPPDRHGGQAAVVPDRGAGGDLDETIGAAVPKRDGVALPDGIGVLQDLAEPGQALALDRRSSAARTFGRRGRIQTGIEPQPGDDTDIAADGGEEFDGGEGGVADEDDATAGQPAVDL